ncbi:MAG: PadR family transcriptional regulator [Planctomycetes bacterium]|nr:PadR family transcriptional regulator [Planctomycetota bacterium]
MGAGKTEFLKGCTETIVLSLLAQREMYGYELVEEIRARSKGALVIAQGTVYPLLYSLERKGLVRGRDARAAAGTRRRRYYALTRAGAAAVQDRVEVWRGLVLAMSRLVGGPAFVRG